MLKELHWRCFICPYRLEYKTTFLFQQLFLEKVLLGVDLSSFFLIKVEHKILPIWAECESHICAACLSVKYSLRLFEAVKMLLCPAVSIFQTFLFKLIIRDSASIWLLPRWVDSVHDLFLNSTLGEVFARHECISFVAAKHKTLCLGMIYSKGYTGPDVLTLLRPLQAYLFRNVRIKAWRGMYKQAALR